MAELKARHPDSPNSPIQQQQQQNYTGQTCEEYVQKNQLNLGPFALQASLCDLN